MCFTYRRWVPENESDESYLTQMHSPPLQHLTSNSVAEQSVVNVDCEFEEHKQNESTQSSVSAKGQTNLLVSNIPPNANDEWLRTHFHRYGLIVSARVMICLATMKNKGYGFVQYAEPYMAEHAVLMLNGSMIDGVSIGVESALKGRDSNKKLGQFITSKICVNNAPLHYGISDIAALCSHYGSVSLVSSQHDDDVISIDDDVDDDHVLWTVRYNHIHEARTAIQQLNGRLLLGSHSPLDVYFMPPYKQQRQRRRRHAKVAAAGAGAASIPLRNKIMQRTQLP
jgi:RNA recognition motif-containing protein